MPLVRLPLHRGVDFSPTFEKGFSVQKTRRLVSCSRVGVCPVESQYIVIFTLGEKWIFILD